MHYAVEVIYKSDLLHVTLKNAKFCIIEPYIVNGFNDLNWQGIHNISLLYNKTIVDLCFGRHEVFLNRIKSY